MCGRVEDNITLGSRYADDQMSMQAEEIAGVTKVVKRHTGGFDMAVGERGA